MRDINADAWRQSDYKRPVIGCSKIKEEKPAIKDFND
jgi:hypothetical protein